jgi:Family of unknown function (DUF6134)
MPPLDYTFALRAYGRMGRVLLILAVFAAGWQAARAQETASAGPPDAAYGSFHSFAAYRDGQKIGTHSLSFQRDGERLVVTTSVDLAVKIVGLTAFRYSHRARETWDGSELVGLETTTDDDGKQYVVRATRQADGLVVDRHTPEKSGYTRSLAGFVMPSTHWNLRQTLQSELLNSQKGSVDSIKVTAIGSEPVKTASGIVDAMHYRYEGKDRFAMHQWFDARGRWVKTTFKAHDGSLVEYVLQ